MEENLSFREEQKRAETIVANFVCGCSTERLIALLDRARAGSITCMSQGTCLVDGVYGSDSWDLPQFHDTFIAWCWLGFTSYWQMLLTVLIGRKSLRNRRLVPIILAEVTRRSNLQAQTANSSEQLLPDPEDIGIALQC